MHPNERLIREFHEAQGRFYGGGPAQPLADMLDESVDWHVPGRSSIAGHYHGKEEVLGYFAKRREKARATFRVLVREVLAGDELVMQLAAGQAEVGGRTREWETVGLFRVRAGRIAACWLLPFDQHAFDEIWA